MTQRNATGGSSRNMTSSTADIKRAICDAVADGATLREACRRPGMRCHMTAYRWPRKDAKFAGALREAREKAYQKIETQFHELNWRFLLSHNKQDGEEADKLRWELSKRAKVLGYTKVSWRLPGSYKDQASSAHKAKRPTASDRQRNADALLQRSLQHPYFFRG
jgi:hypothetical protein